jgi:hypothetical protein
MSTTTGKGDAPFVSAWFTNLPGGRTYLMYRNVNWVASVDQVRSRSFTDFFFAAGGPPFLLGSGRAMRPLIVR